MKKIDNSTATVDNLFTDGDPAVPTPATTLPAWFMNMTQVEMVKVVEMAGLTLDTATEGDVLNNQVAEALAVHVAGLDFYNDTGAADAYVLSVTGAAEEKNTEPTYFDGMRVRFLPDNNNTGAATVRVGAQAIKNIKQGAGAGTNPSADRITANVMTELYYDETNDVFKFSQNESSTPAFESQLLHIQEQQSSGVSSGNGGGTAFNNVALNTVLTNEIAGASLSSEQIILPAGEYIIIGSVPFQTGSEDTFFMKTRLYNVTDSSEEIPGASIRTGDATQLSSFVKGKINIGSTKTFELQGRSSAGNNFGSQSSYGTEVYSDIMIWKVG